MKRLQKLDRLLRYLQSFRVPGWENTPIRVVEQGDATGRLQRVGGDQLLISLPQTSIDGNLDGGRESLSIAFFCIDKINAAAWTQELSDRTYSRLLALADAVLARITDDMSGDHPCELLAGFDLVRLDVLPEYSVFGGWSGWSVELMLS